jgi:flavin-dependent dehydrogenase
MIFTDSQTQRTSAADTAIITTDICIIGSGPSGMTASLTLAKHGIPHLIVDSSSFPRNKPCSDTITSNVLRELNEIDPEIIKSFTARHAALPLWRTNVFTPNGNKISINYLPFNGQENIPSSYSIPRHEFDLMLFNRVKQYPFIQVRQHCHISSVEHFDDHISLHTRNGETIHARTVIVAAGSNTALLKYFGGSIPYQHCSVGIRTYYRNVQCDPEANELFLDKDIMPGALCITPLADHTINLNMAIFLEKVRGEHLNLQKMVDAMIEKHPALKEKFANAVRIAPFEGSRVYLNVRRRVVSGKRFVIAGDSAALVDIVSGIGIPQGMTSGRLGALHTMKAIHANDFSEEFMKQYETDLFRKIGHNLFLGKALYPFLGNRWLGQIVLRLLERIGKRPQTNVLIRDLFYHKKVHRRLLNPMFYYELFLK